MLQSYSVLTPLQGYHQDHFGAVVRRKIGHNDQVSSSKVYVTYFFCKFHLSLGAKVLVLCEFMTSTFGTSLEEFVLPNVAPGLEAALILSFSLFSSHSCAGVRSVLGESVAFNGELLISFVFPE